MIRMFPNIKMQTRLISALYNFSCWGEIWAVTFSWRRLVSVWSFLMLNAPDLISLSVFLWVREGFIVTDLCSQSRFCAAVSRESHTNPVTSLLFTRLHSVILSVFSVHTAAFNALISDQWMFVLESRGSVMWTASLNLTFWTYIVIRYRFSGNIAYDFIIIRHWQLLPSVLIKVQIQCDAVDVSNELFSTSESEITCK